MVKILTFIIYFTTLSFTPVKSEETFDLNNLVPPCIVIAGDTWYDADEELAVNQAAEASWWSAMQLNWIVFPSKASSCELLKIREGVITLYSEQGTVVADASTLILKYYKPNSYGEATYCYDLHFKSEFRAVNGECI